LLPVRIEASLRSASLSRSLNDISALSARPARIEVAEATPLRREPTPPFQSAREHSLWRQLLNVPRRDGPVLLRLSGVANFLRDL